MAVAQPPRSAPVADALQTVTPLLTSVTAKIEEIRRLCLAPPGSGTNEQKMAAWRQRFETIRTKLVEYQRLRNQLQAAFTQSDSAVATAMNTWAAMFV